MLKFFRGNRRKYQIKRDGYGIPARKRCFRAFDDGKRPAEICDEIGISLKTACTYFYQWKNLPREFDSRYRDTRRYLEAFPHARDRIVGTIAVMTGESEKKVRAKLETPWGLHHLVSGKYRRLITEKEKERDRKCLLLAGKILKIHEEFGIPL